MYLKFRKRDQLDYLRDHRVAPRRDQQAQSYNTQRTYFLHIKVMKATLNAAGIDPIYLKITANLIDGMYDDFGERKIGDIDFLVPEKDNLTAQRNFKMVDTGCNKSN